MLLQKMSEIAELKNKQENAPMLDMPEFNYCLEICAAH